MTKTVVLTNYSLICDDLPQTNTRDLAIMFSSK